MIKIGNGFYFIDLQKLNDFIFINESDKSDVEIETITDFRNEKSTVEKKYGPKVQYSGVRYELIKEMLLSVYGAGIESEGGDIKSIQVLDDICIGAKLAFNTLLENGIITDKRNNNK